MPKKIPAYDGPPAPQEVLGLTTTSLERLEEHLPLLLVSDPVYADAACRQLRALLNRCKAIRNALDVAGLPGQMTLSEASVPSSET